MRMMSSLLPMVRIWGKVMWGMQELCLPTAEHQAASYRELTHSSLKWQMKVLIRGQREVPRLEQVVSRKTFKISHPSSRGK